jgi:intracellular septation protein
MSGLQDDRGQEGVEPSKDRMRRRPIDPLFKLVLEVGPLVLFFIANWRFGIFVATGVLMVGVVAALAASWMITRRLPIMPVVTAIAVLIFGSLTFVFHDQTFIKMKPTIVNFLFGLSLLGALAADKPLLPIVLDSVFALSDEGWRKLTLRWGLFFLFLAALNEIVWRTQSTAFWVGFKVFGTIPITLIFALSQTPLILKYETKADRQPDHF